MEPYPDVSSEDKKKIFANYHMRTVWDAQCDDLKSKSHFSAEIILANHFFFWTCEDIRLKSSIQTIKDISELCYIYRLHTIEDISNLTTNYHMFSWLPDKVNLQRLILKCRLVEGHAYEARFDMERSARDLLYKYGLIEAFYISEKLKLKTFNDIKDLSDTQINSLFLPKIEQNKLVELRDACSNNEAYKAFCIAQADKVIEYDNARYQIERKFMHARQDKALAVRAAAKALSLYTEKEDKTIQVEQVNPICFIEFEIN